MGVWAGIITSVIGAVVPMIAGAVSGGPNYPSTPVMSKIPVQEDKKLLEKYAGERFAASKGAWQKKFPLLDKGYNYLLKDIQRNQGGQLSSNIESTLRSSGLDVAKSNNEYGLGQQLGLGPNTLPQRTTQSVYRQIAMQPELTNKISGGTLASMIANNYQNQNAFTQFLGAQNTARYVSGQQQDSYNTGALLTGLGGAAQAGMQYYHNSQYSDPFRSSSVATPSPGYNYYNYNSGGGGSTGSGYAGSTPAAPIDPYGGGSYGNYGGYGNIPENPFNNAYTFNLGGG